MQVFRLISWISVVFLVVHFRGSVVAAEADTKNPAQAQVENPSEGINSEQDEADMGSRSDLSLVEVDLGLSAKQQRDSLMKTLKTEVEAHLSRDDIDKLRRNVMRLGSYRSDWSQEAQDLVVANAPVAELILYQFSMMKNQRLNRRIRETLISFSTMRYPRAALAFLGYFMMSREDIDASLALLEKAIKQEGSLAVEAVNLIKGPLNDIVSLEARLKFAEVLCRRSQWPLDATESLRQWQSQANTFWEKLVSAEVSACLKGE